MRLTRGGQIYLDKGPEIESSYYLSLGGKIKLWALGRKERPEVDFSMLIHCYMLIYT